MNMTRYEPTSSLKLCPYCGGVAQRAIVPEDWGYTPRRVAYECTSCGASTRWFSDESAWTGKEWALTTDAEVQARAAWERRSGCVVHLEVSAMNESYDDPLAKIQAARQVAQQAMAKQGKQEVCDPPMGLDTPPKPRLPAWQDVLGDAEQLIRQKPTFSKIRGTVLENDVPVWIADFAQRLLLRELTRIRANRRGT